MIWIPLPLGSFENIGLKLEVHDTEEISVEFTDYLHVKLTDEIQEWFDSRQMTPVFRKNEQAKNGNFVEIGFEQETNAVEFKLSWQK